MASLDPSRQRIVYLITYSRADTTKFPSKGSFSSAIVEAWQHFGIRVIHRGYYTVARRYEFYVSSGKNNISRVSEANE